MSKSYDLLADHLARGHISQAQYLAALEFRRHFAIADKRRPADLERERPDALTEDQLAAWKSLARVYRALGADGSALVNDALINARTTRQIAEARGRAGEERYFTKRLYECLDCLAEVYGFERGKKIRASGTKSQIIGAL